MQGRATPNKIILNNAMVKDELITNGETDFIQILWAFEGGRLKRIVIFLYS